MTEPASPDDQRFQAIMRRHLDAGMAEVRGWSRAEYVAACRSLWNECETDDEFPYKILHDERLSLTELWRAGSGYVDSRVLEAASEHDEQRADLTCCAVGLLRPDGKLQTATEATERPTVSAGSTEAAPYMIALLDVLGFERMLSQLGLRQLNDLYETILEAVFSTNRMDSAGLLRRTEGTYEVGLAPPLEVGGAHFSDSLLLWVPLLQSHINPFLARCADVFCESLRLGVPLRGAIAVGDCIIHPPSGTFLGEPLVEAARLEHVQEWIGVTLGLSTLAIGIRRELDPDLVIPFPTPCKRAGDELAAGLVLDWPRWGRQTGLDVDAILAALSSQAPEQHDLKHRNTRDFVVHSRRLDGRKHWDAVLLRSVGQLAQEALAAREGHALPDDWTQQIEIAVSLGEEEASVAMFLNDLATGKDDIVLPSTVPESQRRLLAGVLDVASSGDEMIDLLGLGQRVLLCRWRGQHLTVDLTADLGRLRSIDDGLRAVAAFLTDLGDPQLTPEIPSTVGQGHGEILGFLLEIARGDEPPVDINGLGTAILLAREEGRDLPETVNEQLELLALAGDGYAAAAAWLGGFHSSGASQEPGPLPDEVPQSLRGPLRRLAASARRVFVPSATFPALFSMDYDVPLDIAELSKAVVHYHRSGETPVEEFEAALGELENLEHPHDVVASELRSLARREPVGVNLGELPSVVAWHLMLVRAMCEGRPAPMVLEFLGLAAVRSRVTGKPLASYAGYGWHLLQQGGDEGRLAARFLAQVAEGTELPPVPDVSEGWREDLLQIRAMAEYGHLFRVPVIRT